MTRRKGQITGRTATNNCPGHLTRWESLRGDLILGRGPTMTGNSEGRMRRSRTVHSHKLARAAFYIMRDGVQFMPRRRLHEGLGEAANLCTDWD